MKVYKNAMQGLRKETDLACGVKSGTSSDNVQQGDIPCSVALVDVCGIASRKASEGERRVTMLQNHVHTSRLSPVLNILETGNKPNSHNPDMICRY